MVNLSFTGGKIQKSKYNFQGEKVQLQVDILSISPSVISPYSEPLTEHVVYL